MRRTRFMSWIFLVLSLAFFFVRAFRAALEAPLLSLLPEYTKVVAPEVFGKPGPLGRFWKHYSLQRYVSEQDLRSMARDAEKRGDAEFLAFAAFHLPGDTMQSDVLHFANAAVARDTDLTWIYKDVALHLRHQWSQIAVAAQVREQLNDFQAWDPGNAVPYLIRADMARVEALRESKSPGKDTSETLAGLQARLWEKEMDAAFVQPRFETYLRQHFALESKVLRERGWDHPWVVILEMPLGNPDLLNTMTYANHLLDQGSEAEKADEPEAALHEYRRVARFAELLRLQAHTDVEQLFALLIQSKTYDRLVPALQSVERLDEAAAVDYARREVVYELNRRRGDPLSQSSAPAWAAVSMSLSGALVWVFLVVSLIAVAYVNAKRWVRPERKGPLYIGLTVAENYAPFMLFLSCVALSLTYAPFAENFSHYMHLNEPFNTYGYLGARTFPILSDPPPNSLPLQNPYHGYFAYAAAGLALVVLGSFWGYWRQRRQDPSSRQAKLPI